MNEPSSSPPTLQAPVPEHHDELHEDPTVLPVGTIFVVAMLVLATIWLWMLVLGIQQGRVG